MTSVALLSTLPQDAIGHVGDYLTIRDRLCGFGQVCRSIHAFERANLELLNRLEYKDFFKIMVRKFERVPAQVSFLACDPAIQKIELLRALSKNLAKSKVRVPFESLYTASTLQLKHMVEEVEMRNDQQICEDFDFMVGIGGVLFGGEPEAICKWALGLNRLSVIELRADIRHEAERFLNMPLYKPSWLCQICDKCRAIQECSVIRDKASEIRQFFLQRTDNSQYLNSFFIPRSLVVSEGEEHADAFNFAGFLDDDIRASLIRLIHTGTSQEVAMFMEALSKIGRANVVVSSFPLIQMHITMSKARELFPLNSNNTVFNQLFGPIFPRISPLPGELEAVSAHFNAMRQSIESALPAKPTEEEYQHHELIEIRDAIYEQERARWKCFGRAMLLVPLVFHRLKQFVQGTIQLRRFPYRLNKTPLLIMGGLGLAYCARLPWPVFLRIERFCQQLLDAVSGCTAQIRLSWLDRSPAPGPFIAEGPMLPAIAPTLDPYSQYSPP